MAYGVRYRAEWRATTRGERDYVVDILKREYTGSISPLYLTGDCITITYGEVDESELQPIKSSEAEITVLCTEDGNPYMELYTLSPAEYQVVIYENARIIWRGYLATGGYQQPLAKPPYTVRIRANDGISVLKAMPYLDSNGDRFVGNRSVSMLFQSLLSPIADSVDIWNYALLRPKQTSATFDILSIPEEAIYIAFGDNIPTYYDVLHAVLRNFGVQLFQQNGGWVIRSLDTLAVAAKNGLVPTIQIDSPSSYGYGLTANATLSFLPPLRKMTAPEIESSTTRDITDVMCSDGSWKVSTGYAPYRPWIRRYGNAVKAVVRGYGYNTTVMGCATLELPYIFPRSMTTKLTLSVDVYNGRSYDITNLYAGLWLVEPSIDTTDIVYWVEDLGYANSEIRFRRPVCFWDGNYKDASKNKWGALSAMANPTPAKLGLKQIKIDGATLVSNRPALSTLPKTSISFEIPQIPALSDSSPSGRLWKVALVIAGVGEPRSMVYIANPTISVESSANNDNYDDVEIAKDGISDESFDATWRTSEGASSVAELLPMLSDLSREGQRVYSYVVPSAGTADKDVVGKMLYQLRHDTSYTIDGELDDSRIKYGINNVCAYDGRIYYTNYVKRHLKRGISSVQLRELSHLRRNSWQLSAEKFPSLATRDVIGVNNSLFFIKIGSGFGRIDVAANTATIIRTVSTTARLANGVNCIVLRDISIGYVAAYDDNGRKLSEITAFEDNDVSATIFYETAKYDANQQVWLASDKGKNVVMCDSDGLVIDKWQCANPTLSTTISDSEILPYNGGYIYRFYSDAESKYYCYWHCYSIHTESTFEGVPLSLTNNNIRILTDKLAVVLDSTGYYTIMAIDGVDLTQDIVPIATLAIGNEVLLANNAILITRSSGSIAVYDCRNTKGHWYSLGINPSKVALCGDYLVSSPVSSASYYDVRKIIPKISSVNTIAVSADE